MAQGQRHDGWTEARRTRFIDTLRMTGCVRDACRVAGLSSTSAYRVRGREPEFAAAWDAAIAQAATGLEAAAYRRAVEGVEEPVFQGGKQVGTRRRYSDALLRLMLQGAAPEKYGRTGGTPVQKQAEIDEAVQAAVAKARSEWDGQHPTSHKARLAAKLEMMNRRLTEAPRGSGGPT